jgi:two-component system sensor histidine kinase KdpD
MRWWRQSEAAHVAIAALALAGVTLTLLRLDVTNTATVSTTYLMVVLLVATISRLRVAVGTSVAAMLCLNFFFLPPVGTFTIADPQNWVALFAFLAVSLVASNLSAVARARTDEAESRRDEVARLFDLSRDVLLMTDSQEALAVLARAIARRFDLEFVAVAIPHQGEWRLHAAGTPALDIDHREIVSAFAAAQATLEFDAYARTYAGHRTITVDGRSVRLVPLRVGTKPIGVLAASGRPVEPGTLDALAGVVAIGLERAQLLEERKAAELTRQSEQLKTTLLASLSHDLRTPLTAIRIASSNLNRDELTAEERREQSDVILSEVERLSRLFQNVLEMARIDAGAIDMESRWTHPSEIVAAARDHVEQALQRHLVTVAFDPDVPVRLDPRVTATALAHLLENAAHYTPDGSTIDVVARVADATLTIQVRDHGPGIPPGELPRLFERFFRGVAAKARASGTGMGLWIVRGLLAAEQGRVWAENCPDGGAQFTIAVPVSVKPQEAVGAGMS